MSEQPERDVEQMEERSKELGEDISDAREEWQRMRADESVPGTPPAPKGAADQGDEEREPWPDE